MKRRSLIAAALLCTVPGAVPVAAKETIAARAGEETGRDKVTLAGQGLAGRTTLSGTIVDFTGTVLTLRTSRQNRVERYSAADVVAIESHQVESHRRGLTALAEGRVELAERDLKAALDEEGRAWVRRQILAALVRCALGRGDRRDAATRFLLIVESDPQTRRYEVLPLAWDAFDEDRLAGDVARRWLDHPSPIARLIGASLLAGFTENAAVAEKALRALAASAERPIRDLASAQLWRFQLANGGLKRDDVRTWEKCADSLPQECRWGPNYLIGRAYVAVGDRRRAVDCFLWPPLVEPADCRLCGRACVAAAESLASLNRADEARIVRNLAASRFHVAPVSTGANDLLTRPKDRLDANLSPADGP